MSIDCDGDVIARTFLQQREVKRLTSAVGALGKDIVDAFNACVPDADKITVFTCYDTNGCLRYELPPSH